MRIGIDFDNTLADYSGVFHQVAQAEGWLEGDVETSKKAVKQFFISRGNERTWTKLQGIVYGQEISRARLYSGAKEVIGNWLEEGHEIFIVSHKTRYPVIGDFIDLHDCALRWLQVKGVVGSGRMQISSESVFFRETRPQKIDRIAGLALDVFIDDLPEVFMEPEFPSSVRKLLFDPDNHYDGCLIGGDMVSTWMEVAASIRTL